MLVDVVAYDASKLRLAREVVPLDISARRLAGGSPVKIWREYRGLTQEKLARLCKVSRLMIAAIEACHKTGGIGMLKTLAVVLTVDLDHLT